MKTSINDYRPPSSMIAPLWQKGKAPLSADNLAIGVERQSKRADFWRKFKLKHSTKGTK